MCTGLCLCCLACAPRAEGETEERERDEAEDDEPPTALARLAPLDACGRLCGVQLRAACGTVAGRGVCLRATRRTGRAPDGLCDVALTRSIGRGQFRQLVRADVVI